MQTKETGNQINQSTQEKVISLFKYVAELNKIKQKVVLDVQDYPWYRYFDSFPDDSENIKVCYRDRVEDVDSQDTSDVLLAVHKPSFQSCPKFDAILNNWIEPGWDNFRNEVKVKDYIFKDLNDINLSIDFISNNAERIVNDKYKEYFNDEPQRKLKLDLWLDKRNEWVINSEKLLKTRDFFTELYKVCVDLDRESETLELVVADGFIKDRDLPELKHPILTKRVNIYHDAFNNTIYIQDTDVTAELNTVIFQNMNDVNLSYFDQMREEVNLKDYHPLDRNELPLFFKEFINRISPNSCYLENNKSENTQSMERLLLYSSPCFILRKRLDGALKAIEQIVQNIEETDYIPAPIIDLVEGGFVDVPEDDRKLTIEEELAAVGGESVDILLSKEANKEQLEIARRIENFNAVLVQGPPGTGKTHTIANLLGHFLSQGKRVLVTSHTQKALNVLKDKVAPELQNLCVSLLDDSNVDMEKSVDGISHFFSDNNITQINSELKELEYERNHKIKELGETRNKLFTILNQEYKSIVFNGEEISPLKAADFVNKNSEKLSYIPGKVKINDNLPLTLNEFSELYRSNANISLDDETELNLNLPDPNLLIAPEDFENNIYILKSNKEKMDEQVHSLNWKTKIDLKGKSIEISLPYANINIPLSNKYDLEILINYINTFKNIEKWMQYCAVDGKKGGAYREKWNRLIQQIQETVKLADIFESEKLGKEIKILNNELNYLNKVKQLKEKYRRGWKKSKFVFIGNKQLDSAINGAAINGQPLKTVDDCQLIIDKIEIESLRSTCASYWNELLAVHGVKAFNELDDFTQENVAAKFIPLIEKYLDWYKNEYGKLVKLMDAVGISKDVVFQYDPLDSEIRSTEKILSALNGILPEICNILLLAYSIDTIQNDFDNNGKILTKDKLLQSTICKELYDSNNVYDYQKYQTCYDILKQTYEKSYLKSKREEYLNRLAMFAPDWAEAIRERKGIHGETNIPNDLMDAWKWKQFETIINLITDKNYDTLQAKSLELSKEYRKITAKYAEKLAWYHLLKELEGNLTIQQALIGWKQTIKKIGKGTGKNAPKLRAEARRLMSQCQNAVPVWIMPVYKALENLNPRTNKFDIVIIDEASQSDLTSLAILYLGKKLIIVGDDKQVSPMAIGTQIDRINALKDMYISKKIPNDHLYDAKTSIYDIAATTFRPLMLKEHFRCAPEIIRFSNWLSYDFKIKPLRDCSNNLVQPPVVNYRVKNGERIDDINPNEAKTIVALMKACMEQKEYDGKTFGVISLLGNEQVKLIQEEIYKHIDLKDISQRKILCGNASNFQGDERDVIFLSVVDSANGKGPLILQGFGVDDSARKRYNVATSRAKDQLWVVDSLDSSNDLKQGDIRKMLIDFSIDPNSVVVSNERIEKESESPFESSVARALIARGYNLVQQWKVGSYRIDMVVLCGNKKVAIECDGERWHSTEAQIRNDMERQTILERLNWNFIRVRGSEYYRNPEKTIERIITELNKRDILPESNSVVTVSSSDETELLSRVKSCASEMLSQTHDDNSYINSNLIADALNPKEIIKEFDNKVNINSCAERFNNLNETTIVNTINSENKVNEYSFIEEKPKTNNKGKRGLSLSVPTQNQKFVSNKNTEKSERSKTTRETKKEIKKTPFKEEVLTQDQQVIIDNAFEISANTWFALSHWAKETNNFDTWQRRLLYSVGKRIDSGVKPSIKQAVYAMDIYKSALSKGFKPE